eukprot:361186-Chlamydomonas_euryale.AAC.8
MGPVKEPESQRPGLSEFAQLTQPLSRALQAHVLVPLNPPTLTAPDSSLQQPPTIADSSSRPPPTAALTVGLGFLPKPLKAPPPLSLPLRPLARHPRPHFHV